MDSTPDPTDIEADVQSVYQVTHDAAIRLFSKHRHYFVIYLNARNAGMEFHEYRIAQCLGSVPDIIDRARMASQKERDAVQASFSARFPGDLDDTRSFEAIKAYAERLQQRIKSRLCGHSRKFWYLLYARLWHMPIHPNSESKWSRTLILRTLELAIAKFGSINAKDVLAVGHTSWAPGISDKLVLQMLEVIDLTREFYYATASMRRTAKGGRLDYESWTVKHDDESARLIKLYDERVIERSERYSESGIFANHYTNGNVANWVVQVAIANDANITWPLRSSLITRKPATGPDAADGNAYVPNYIFLPEEFATDLAALVPFRSSIEKRLRFRLEDLFAAIAAIGLTTVQYQEISPSVYAQIQRGGYLVSRKDLIHERLCDILPTIFKAYGVSLPNDVKDTARLIQDFLTLAPDETIDLERRKPLKPLIPLSDTEVRVDFRLLPFPIREVYLSLPTLSESDNQTRSDDFEIAVRDQITQSIPGATPWRTSSEIEFSDGSKRELDASVMIGDVLLLCECKARSIGDKMELAAPAFLDSRWETSVEYIDDVDTLASALIEKEIVRGPAVPDNVKWILPVVVEPHAEYIPLTSTKFWVIADEVPRIMTVDECVKVAEIINSGDRSVLNLRPRI